MKPKKVVCLFLIVIFILSFSACSFDGGNNKKVAAYLNSIAPDFEKSKEDLKLFDEQYGDDLEGATKALEVVKTSKSDFQASLDKASKLEVPDKPAELKSFHNSLISYYTDTIKLLDEYEQIVNYSVELLGSITPIEKAAVADLGKAPSMEEIKTMVKGLKTSITESISASDKCTPPQYMADSHSNYVSVLKKFGSATDDFIYALQLSDPLRINAANYRYELLSNKINKVSQEMNKDIDEQQSKMDEIGKRLQATQDGIYKQLLLWQGQYKAGS